MTEEQQEPVIKITDHYFTNEEVADMIWQYLDLQEACPFGFTVDYDEIGFYWREETEI